MSERRDPVDPSVSQLLGDKRRKTTAQRRKAKRDASRSKATYDLPPAIVERIDEIAQEEGCPKSGVAKAFLHDAIQRYEDREIDLTALKWPSDSPRYDFTIRLPGEEVV